MFGEEIQETAKNWRYQEQVNAASRSVSEVEKKLRSAQETQQGGAKAITQSGVWDWASSYQRFALWEDLDELRELKTKEESKLRTVMERNTNLGHYHDHSEERKIFELPEREKMAFCERHRLLGNALHQEGCIHAAAENYKLALSYYEYCFPESAEEQQVLDTVRYASLCNISLCYRRMGHFRWAIEAASKALQAAQAGDSAKALFRRAQAYCDLDEYANAQSDLRAALEMSPGDAAILQEMERVVRVKSCATHADERLAKSMLTQQQQQTRVTPLLPPSSISERAGKSGMEMWGDLHVPLEPWAACGERA